MTDAYTPTHEPYGDGNGAQWVTREEMSQIWRFLKFRSEDTSTLQITASADGTSFRVSGSDTAPLTVTHNTTTRKIVITQNGWATGTAPYPSYAAKVANLVDLSISIPDSFTGTFVVGIYVKRNIPGGNTALVPIGGAGLEFVQNGHSSGDNYVPLTNAQMGITPTTPSPLDSWYLARHSPTLLPIAVINIVGPSTAVTITSSMMERDHVVSELQRIVQERSWGWNTFGGPMDILEVYCMASNQMSVGGGLVRNVQSVTMIPLLSVFQPFTGYLIARWNNTGLSALPQIVLVTLVDFANVANYGDAGTYQGTPLLFLHIDGGRLLDVTPYHHVPTLVPSIRTPRVDVADRNEQISFFNGIMVAVADDPSTSSQSSSSSSSTAAGQSTSSQTESTSSSVSSPSSSSQSSSSSSPSSPSSSTESSTQAATSSSSSTTA